MSATPAATPSSRVDSAAAQGEPAAPPSTAAASVPSAALSSAAAAVMVSGLAVPGGTYTGPVVKGKPEGHGQLIALDDSVYTGEFSQGQKHGVGACQWTNGRVYAGQWEDNKRAGFGVQWNARGKLTECGRWQDDKLVASCAVPLRFVLEGKWRSAIGQSIAVYALRWSLLACAAHPDGSLVLLAEDGRFYIGPINAQGQPHGQGASFHPDGTPEITLLVDEDASLSGRWVDGLVNGRASQVLTSGDRYEGMFKDGEREGVGAYIWEDGRRYEGEWVAGTCNGLGAQWNKEGKLAGCGRWASSTVMASCAVPLRCISDDKLSAAAVKAKRDHPTDSALLADRSLHAPHELLGTHYVGPLNKRGQPHGPAGQGASFNIDGSPRVTLVAHESDARQSGRWVDGKLYGRATRSLPSGRRDDGLFQNGQLHGLGERTMPDGVRYEGEFVEDKRSGQGVEWGRGGEIVTCGQWEHDQLVTAAAVPLQCLPEKRFLSPHAKTASLLFPDGGYFVGPINAQNQRHGEGSMFSASGALLSSGAWSNDQLQSSSASAQIAPAPSAAATSAASASATAAASSSSSSPSSSFAFQLPLQCSNRKALLIGNGKYDAPVSSLGCCTNDAEDMESALRQLGFQCKLLLNASRKQINAALSEFIHSLEKNDIVFFHFSGHGEESAGVTYMLPTDYGDSKSLEDEAVSLNRIMQRLNSKNCDLINIIVLDCCRANVHDDTFRGSDEVMRSAAMSSVDDRTGGQSFVRKLTSAQFFVAYSSDPGTVSFETRGGRNGWFTGCLLPHLQTPDLHLEQIFKRTLRDLDSKSGGKQQSWSHAKLKVDVILFPTQEPL